MQSMKDGLSLRIELSSNRFWQVARNVKKEYSGAVGGEAFGFCTRDVEETTRSIRFRLTGSSTSPLQAVIE